MALLTVADVISEARGHLMDTSAVSGVVMTDAQYIRHVNAAISKLVQSIRALRMFRVVRDGYFIVPANQNFLNLDKYLPDFSAALRVWEKPCDSNQNIAAWAGAENPWTITITNTTGMVVGQNFIITVPSDPRLNGSFVIKEVTDATHIKFVGPTTGYAATPTGGILGLSNSAQWSDVGYVDFLRDFPVAPVTGITQMAFSNGGIQFPQQATDRMIRMRYLCRSNQVALSTDILDIQEAMPLLGLLTAIGASGSAGGHPERIAALREEVYGVPGDPGQPGLIALLKRHYALQEQATQRIRPLWRPRQAPVYGTLVRT